MRRRIGIIALLHESNTFIDACTTLDHFRRDVLLTGESVREYFAKAKHEVGGFLVELDRSDVEIVPIFAARAVPHGPIDADAFSTLVSMMLSEVRKAGSLDGVLAAPHGATVAVNAPDADGHWLAELRREIGPNVPIVATIDAHANLSQQMVDATDVLVAYRTNPHLDQFERGCEAARLMLHMVNDGKRFRQTAAFPPLAINIQTQNTSVEPLASVWAAADQLRSDPGVASLSLVLGFPYADVAEMGSSAIVVCDADTTLEKQRELTRELEQLLRGRSGDYEPDFVSPSDAVRQASQASGTSCLLDMGDNVGGGGPGDATHLAHELHQQVIGPTFVCLNDPAAVQTLETRALGDTQRLTVGGNSGALHGKPLDVQVELISRHDGKFQETQVRHGGWAHFDQGPTAIVRTVDSDLTIMLTSRRTPPFSLAQMTAFGIQPHNYRAISAKGVIAPMAAYGPVVDRCIHVNTRGCTCADMRQMEYHHRRRPMLPFEKY